MLSLMAIDRICCGQEPVTSLDFTVAVSGSQDLKACRFLISLCTFPLVASSRTVLGLNLAFNLVLEKQNSLVASLGVLVNGTFTVGISTTVG